MYSLEKIKEMNKNRKTKNINSENSEIPNLYFKEVQKRI